MRKEKHDHARPSKRKHLLRPMKEMEKEVKEYLLPSEHVVYQSHEMFFTDRRIIKHRCGWLQRAFHHAYSAFEDLDLRFLESIKARHHVNRCLLAWGLIIMLLGPIGSLLSVVPGLRWLGGFLVGVSSGMGAGGVLLAGIVLVASALILRDRIIEFRGLGGAVITTTHLHDEELLKVRELQHVRWRRMNMDK